MLSRYKKLKGYHLTYTIGDFHDTYRKKYSSEISRRKFIDFLVDFITEVRKEIVENRYQFNLPHRMGLIRIAKRKNKGNLNTHRVDFKRTSEAKERIFYLNLHTDRHYFKYLWEKPRSKMMIFKNYMYYYFKPVRAATIYLGRHIIKCSNDPNMRDYDCLN